MALIIIPTITALTLLLIPGKEADLFKFFFSVKKILEKIFITITNIYTIYTNRVCWNDITAAILVSQNNEMAAMLVS